MPHKPLTLSQKIADFIVKVEFDQRSLLEDTGMRQYIESKSREIDFKLNTIEAEISHFRTIMTRTGAAKWQSALETLQKETKRQLESLEETCEQTLQLINAECSRLNHSSMSTVKNVSQLLMEAKQYDLHKAAEEKSLELQKACEKNLNAIRRTVYGFRWKNLGLAVILSAAVATIVSLYINDEWPWQMHNDVLKQRQAGQVLMTSWSHLSQADRTLLLKNP